MIAAGSATLFLLASDNQKNDDFIRRVRAYVTSFGQAHELRVLSLPPGGNFAQAFLSELKKSKYDTCVLWSESSGALIKESELLCQALGDVDIVVGSRFVCGKSIVQVRNKKAFLWKFLAHLEDRVMTLGRFSDLRSGCWAFKKSWMMKAMESLPSGIESPSDLVKHLSKRARVREIGIMWICE